LAWPCRTAPSSASAARRFQAASSSNGFGEFVELVPSLFVGKSVGAMLEASVTDSVAPAICTEPECDHTTEMEPDQDAGYCEACGKNSVASALVLAGLI
jgi:hypothetical protein